MTYTTSNHQGQCIGIDLAQLLNFILIDWLVGHVFTDCQWTQLRARG